MEINQYFISNVPFTYPQNGRTFSFGNFTLWAHENLEITSLKKTSQELLLLGFIFDPDFPQKSNFEILEDLVEKLEMKSDSFFNHINKLTGRFVLLFKTDDIIMILNDAAAQRQVFYRFQNDDFYATSSPKLFYEATNFEFKIPAEKIKILKSKRFKVLEEWFPGDEYVDSYLKRLLPNFFINLESQSVKRIPFQVQNISKQELKENIKNQIFGSIEASALRFGKILFGVTAGSDSRLVFNSMPLEEKIEYFLYKRESENDIDFKIAKKLTQKKKINLSVIQPEKLSDSFLKFYKAQFLYPRILSKLRNIQWLKNNFKNSNALIITGYAGELYRNCTNTLNPYQHHFSTSKDFIDYLYYPKTEYLDNSMKSWMRSAEEYLKNCKNLSFLDLFHWEHHMALYGGKYTYEQDLSGVELFCPLANRQIILNLIHNTTSKERSAPNGVIYQIIDETSPEWKGIPYNPKPIRKKLKDFVFSKLPLKVVNRIINR